MNKGEVMVYVTTAKGGRPRVATHHHVVDNRKTQR